MSQEQNEKLLKQTIALLDAYRAQLLNDADCADADNRSHEAFEQFNFAAKIREARDTLAILRSTGDLPYPIADRRRPPQRYVQRYVQRFPDDPTTED